MRVFGVESSAKLHLIEPIILPVENWLLFLKLSGFQFFKKNGVVFIMNENERLLNIYNLEIYKKEIGIN